MLIDHIGFLFFPDQMLWRLIGRISFPLFAFLIAEGFLKTKNVENYLKRLLLFAGISQLPYSLFSFLAKSDPWQFNIMITLALGLVSLIIIQSQKGTLFKIVLVSLILIFADMGNVSYGIYGILTMLASFAFLQKDKLLGSATLFTLPLLETLRLFFYKIYFLQAFAIFSLPFIWLYNGKQGLKLSRWWFYWFYPVHLLVLCLIFVFCGL